MRAWLEDNPWLVPLLCIIGVAVTFLIGGFHWAVTGAVIFAVTGIVALLNTLRISRRRVAALDEEIRRLSDRGSQLPFLESPGSHEYSIPEVLMNAQRVSISGRTAMALFVRYGGEMIERIRSGADVRVLILDPRSTGTADLYAGDRGSYDANLQAVRAGIERVYRAAENAAGSFEVRLLECAPTYGCVMAEKDSPQISAAILHLYFAYTRVGADRPVIALTSKDRWFTIFLNEFNTAWREGKSWSSLNASKIRSIADGSQVAEAQES